MTSTKNFFLSDDEKQQLVEAIGKAELSTSGEIRVHVVSHPLQEEILIAAQKTFEKLGMTQTQERNGVLFFVALTDRQFIVLGDQGIHQKVRQDFWDLVRNQVIQEFQQGRFLEGLVVGIKLCGEQLAGYFPKKSTNPNELSDSISTEND